MILWSSVPVHKTGGERARSSSLAVALDPQLASPLRVQLGSEWLGYNFLEPRAVSAQPFDSKVSNVPLASYRSRAITSSALVLGQ